MGHMTAAGPTWAILVPTIGERRELFGRLMDGLIPQTLKHDGRVRVHGWFNNGRPSLPEIRQRMVRAAGTEYVSFVDDDDVVAPYFVDEVMAALAGRPDYVGFQVQCYSDGAPTAISYHDLTHGRWENQRHRHLRDISHINPIRTTLALTADFSRARRGQPEDRVWADQLRRGKKLREQVVIDRIMYHYLYRPKRSTAGSRWRPVLSRFGSVRPEVVHPYFTWSDPDA